MWQSSSITFVLFRININTINIHFGLKTLKILIRKHNLYLTCKPKAKQQNTT